MQNAVAFADNDITVVAWSYGKKPVGCMGFAVYRVDSTGRETPLPSHAVFKGFEIKEGQSTRDFPVQKFYWKDPYARLIAEETGSRRFRYKVVPLQGTPGHLVPMPGLPHVVSNEVEISSEVSPGMHAFFNRGIISTQRVSRYFKGNPTRGALLDMVADPANPLRAALSGDMVEALAGFLDRAKSEGTIYAALYELGDRELIAKLVGLGDRLRIVLSNASDPPDTNRDARDKLASAGVKWDRIMPSGHIGHNKFLVYADKDGVPRAVLLGSTNWTPTGLCTQTNNTLVLDNPGLAARYLAYWRKLAADTKAAAGVASALQAASLRSWDAKGRTLPVRGNSLESWFSPNTPGPRGKGGRDEKRPPDMDAVAEHIEKAQHAILFLAFNPGTPGVAVWTAQALKKNKNLFVRGCVTARSTAEEFYYELKGALRPKRKKGDKTPLKEDPRVIGAEAFDGKIVPEGWRHEILSAGWAIVHDKILVIDPFSADCVVVTGSHNLGHKASFDNDENLVIIQGNRNLAVAYATHVLDVYDHFSWRYLVKTKSEPGAEHSLSDKPDKWMEKYFDEKGALRSTQLDFWMRAALT